MADIELRNESGLKFTDISSEEWRTYYFALESANPVISITDPQYLHVSRSGGHRILTADGMSHYIPKGWYHLSWKAKEGTPHFVK